MCRKAAVVGSWSGSTASTDPSSRFRSSTTSIRSFLAMDCRRMTKDAGSFDRPYVRFHGVSLRVPFASNLGIFQRFVNLDLGLCPRLGIM